MPITVTIELQNASPAPAPDDLDWQVLFAQEARENDDLRECLREASKALDHQQHVAATLGEANKRLSAELESERRIADVGKSFHGLAVKERDHAWQELRLLQASLAADAGKESKEIANLRADRDRLADALAVRDMTIQDLREKIRKLEDVSHVPEDGDVQVIVRYYNAVYDLACDRKANTQNEFNEIIARFNTLRSALKSSNEALEDARRRNAALVDLVEQKQDVIDFHAAETGELLGYADYDDVKLVDALIRASDSDPAECCNMHACECHKERRVLRTALLARLSSYNKGVAKALHDDAEDRLP